MGNSGSNIRVPDLTKWRHSKITISIGTIIVVFSALVGMHEYTVYHLDDVFMSTADADDLVDKVEKALDKSNSNAELFLDYIRRQDLSDARDSLQNHRDDLRETLLWEDANQGENQISRERKEELRDRIREKEALVQCLEAGRENCNG